MAPAGRIPDSWRCGKYSALTAALLTVIIIHLATLSHRACLQLSNEATVSTEVSVRQVATHATAFPQQQPPPPRLLSRTRMREIIQVAKKELVYVAPAKLVLMTMAKAGSSMVLIWLYRGLSGHNWSASLCGTIHNRSSTCWEGLLTPLQNMEEDEQWRVLTDPKVMRAAVQRHPLERLISAYKSKYTCEGERFNTDAGREKIVPYLRRQLQLPPGPTCMNISEFGHALDVARANVGLPGFPLRSLRTIENHIRPQEYFFDDIDYDVVLDVNDLSDPARIAPINRRLPYQDGMDDRRRQHYASGDAVLRIPEGVVSQLYDYARLSKHGPEKYIP